MKNNKQIKLKKKNINIWTPWKKRQIKHFRVNATEQVENGSVIISFQVNFVYFLHAYE